MYIADVLQYGSSITIGETGDHIRLLQAEYGAGIPTGVWTAEDEAMYREFVDEFVNSVALYMILEERPQNWVRI